MHASMSAPHACGGFPLQAAGQGHNRTPGPGHAPPSGPGVAEAQRSAKTSPTILQTLFVSLHYTGKEAPSGLLHRPRYGYGTATHRAIRKAGAVCGSPMSAHCKAGAVCGSPMSAPCPAVGGSPWSRARTHPHGQCGDKRAGKALPPGPCLRAKVAGAATPTKGAEPGRQRWGPPWVVAGARRPGPQESKGPVQRACNWAAGDSIGAWTCRAVGPSAAPEPREGSALKGLHARVGSATPRALVLASVFFVEGKGRLGPAHVESNLNTSGRVGAVTRQGLGGLRSVQQQDKLDGAVRNTWHDNVAQ
jgi:hypothetical protein